MDQMIRIQHDKTWSKRDDCSRLFWPRINETRNRKVLKSKKSPGQPARLSQRTVQLKRTFQDGESQPTTYANQCEEENEDNNSWRNKKS